MNTKGIEKAIELLNSQNFDELKDFLEFERQSAILSDKGRKTSLLTAVKKILEQNKESRPLLATIQHDEQNRQFICDGYIAVIWNEYKPEFDCFKQTDNNSSIKIMQILGNKKHFKPYKLNDDEILILKNLEKYKCLYKAERTPNGAYPICLFGKAWDCNLLLRLINLIGYFNEIYLTDEKSQPAEIFREDIDAIFLPFTCINNEEVIKKRTADFLRLLKDTENKKSKIA